MDSPRTQAARVYREGIAKDAAADFAGAKVCFRKALELDGTMAEAAFRGGLAGLDFQTPDEAEALGKRLVEQAKQGDTQTLDDCDSWLRDCIERCDRTPDRQPADQKFCSTRRIKSAAQSLLAMTALLRGVAAAQVGKEQDASAWLAESDKYLQQAQATDPDDPQMKSVWKQCETVKEVLRSGTTSTAPSASPGTAPPMPSSVAPDVSPPTPGGTPNPEQSVTPGQYRPPASSPPQQPPTSAPPQQPPTSAPPQQPPTSAPPQQPPTSAPPQQPPTSAPPTQPSTTQPSTPSQAPASTQPATPTQPGTTPATPPQ